MKLINKIDFNIDSLESMKKYPQDLFYIGNTNLIKKTKISIVGSRASNQYSKQLIYEISNKLANVGVCIVSGGAMGIDTMAHQGAGMQNTIMVAGTGLDNKYPALNRKMIEDIENNGLVLSQFEVGMPSYKWNFPLRNELLVALGDVLIVGYADIKSGTTRSVEYALKMGKQIYVLPHRINESLGTNKLVKENKAKVIYDVDEFVSSFSSSKKRATPEDEFLEYCKSNPTYDEAVRKDATKVFEYELYGKIDVVSGKIYLA